MRIGAFHRNGIARQMTQVALIIRPVEGFEALAGKRFIQERERAWPARSFIQRVTLIHQDADDARENFRGCSGI